MKPSAAAKRADSKPFFVPLSSCEPVRLVCAGLVLAVLTALFRIASIW
jgi:hypothetical protein